MNAQKEHLITIEEWCNQRQGPCECGGMIRTGYTPIKLVIVENGVWESLVHANCDECGKGEQVSITKAELRKEVQHPNQLD